MRGKSPEETAMDLVVEDHTRVDTVYFLMSEDNVRRQIKIPWVSFGSDAAAPAPEGVFLKSNPHPRAYGNFARLLGRYVRDEKARSARGSRPPARELAGGEPEARATRKARAGNYADVVIFDPATIQDHATFEAPHALATGVRDVLVNGRAVLRDGNRRRVARPRRAWSGLQSERSSQVIAGAGNGAPTCFSSSDRVETDATFSARSHALRGSSAELGSASDGAHAASDAREIGATQRVVEHEHLQARASARRRSRTPRRAPRARGRAADRTRRRDAGRGRRRRDRRATDRTSTTRCSSSVAFHCGTRSPRDRRSSQAATGRAAACRGTLRTVLDESGGETLPPPHAV
jgi:hypothetical protein